MKVYVITGMSGAGKSMVVKQFEDMGFFCVDNLPPSLIPTIVEICRQTGGKMDNLALVTDIRGGVLLNELMPSLEALRQMGISCQILFLEASDKTLVKRFKESRRTHPLAPEGRIMAGIGEERQILEPIKSNATYVVDTSNFKTAQLREEIAKIVGDDAKFSGIVINVLTFGFKYGLPMDTDLVFDVRFTPNPFYVPELKEMTGLSAKVAEYVFGFPETVTFVDKLTELLAFLIPFYKREGKSQLEIGIGCTGGKHRSVAVGAELRRRLESLGNRVLIEHRDIDRDAVVTPRP
ncbi:MAG: RNase adapter RapZ [Clostridiales bacterium]|nr:RNase adapter RapZ [Clostridiales bacterium]